MDRVSRKYTKSQTLIIMIFTKDLFTNKFYIMTLGFQYHLASGYQLTGLSLNLSDFKYVLIP